MGSGFLPTYSPDYNPGYFQTHEHLTYVWNQQTCFSQLPLLPAPYPNTFGKGLVSLPPPDRLVSLGSLSDQFHGAFYRKENTPGPFSPTVLLSASCFISFVGVSGVLLTRFPLVDCP